MELGLLRILRGVAFLCCASILACAQTPSLANLHKQFITPPDNSRIMMRWWWFGPAVVNAELEREMRVMKDAGIGGFEVQPVYPVALDDQKIHNLTYLSTPFLDSLKFTAVTAKSLGLRMDLTIGSGWPYGGPHIPANLAAGRLRIDKLKMDATGKSVMPPLAGGEAIITAFQGDKEVNPSTVHEGEITFFISSRTGQQVKRPAIGAEGFVLDHYDRAAIQSHLRNVGDKLMTAFGPDTPYSVFCDSLEVYAADWTPDLLAEFQKRRGYDLRPHLPQLASGAGDEGLAVRSDWGQTLTDLLNDRFFAPLQQWAKFHGTQLRAQAYGMPPASISSALQIDLPEGEGIQWKTLSQMRYATSSAHVTGKPVVSSETWTWLHSPVFRATPLDMKAEANLHFLQGVNQLVGHGFPYTAPGVEYPGWRFYASAAFGENNPWWIAMPEVARYCQRLSFLLRAGKPANDIALYMPNHDAWAHFAPGKVDLRATLAERIGPDMIPTILESGYGFDAFDDGILATAKIEKDKLAMGSGTYSLVILPNVEMIPLATLRKLEEFSKNLGFVVATRRLPDKAPGLNSAADSAEVRKIVARMFQGDSPTAYFVADDKAALAERLNNRVLQDVVFPPEMKELGFVHRVVDLPSGNADIYFVANTGNQFRAAAMGFRGQPGVVPEIWDPVSGTTTLGQPFGRQGGLTRMVVALEPYGSRVVIFSKEVAKEVPPPVAGAPMDLSTGWTIAFGEKGPAHPIAAMKSWTEDAATRYYSGTAAYEREVTLAADAPRAMLSFGEGQASARTRGMGYQAEFEGPVREAAVVYVNGTRAGAVWCPPYQLEIAGLLHAGKNQLRVVVGNLAVNDMAGKRLPDYKLLNLRYGERFTAQDMDKIEPVTAGLLGPIQLTVGGK